MNTTTKTAELIRERIEAMPIGEPFTPTAFLECGTRASVDQTLSRLAKAGSIERVTRGVFVRPEVNRFVGKVMPEPLKVAETVAKTTGAVIQVHGAEAARRLELTTQVPTQSVFVTSGPSKRIRVGKMEIRLAARLSAQAGPSRPTCGARACCDVVPRQEGSDASPRREDSAQAGIKRVRGTEVSHQLDACVDGRRHLPKRADGRSCLSPSCIKKPKTRPKTIGH